MRLNMQSKALVCGNINLLKYCQSSGISIEKLKGCNIEKMGNNYIFVLSKENKPKSKSSLPLDVDIETQPDIILIMEVAEDETINFETTDKTVRVLAV
jgi:hypothetical protein